MDKRARSIGTAAIGLDGAWAGWTTIHPSGKWGITMLRHWSAFGLLAAGILLSSGACAWAFSQQSVGPGDNGNSAFTDPDDQITNNFGVRLNEQPSARMDSNSSCLSEA